MSENTPQLNCRTVTMVDCGDWDAFVMEVYGRPYDYQQQDGCRSRGVMSFIASTGDIFWGYDDATPEELMGNEYNMGVSLKSWLTADPTDRSIKWDRHFYPEIEELAQDLCKRGLLPAGRYTMNIDW